MRKFHNTTTTVRICLLLIITQLAEQQCTTHGFTVVPSIYRKRPIVSLFTTTKESSSDEITNMFTTYSNDDGYMTKQLLLKVPMISELLSDGELLESELNEFWGSVTDTKNSDTIDFDSFVQIYQNIDNLFEEEDDEEDEDDEFEPKAKDDDDDTNMVDDDDLTEVFQNLCKNNDEKTVSKEVLLKDWTEVVTLLNDNLVSKEEVNNIWDQTSEGEKINIDGFLRFNTLLDELFEFDDGNDDVEDNDGENEDDDEDVDDDDNNIDDEKTLEVVDEKKDDNDAVVVPEKKERKKGEMIEGDDLSWDVLFYSLVNSKNLIGKKDLMYWQELQDMLKEGDLLESELDDLIKKHAFNNIEGIDEELYLGKGGFLKMYQAIENLFEDDDDDDDTNAKPNASSSSIVKDAIKKMMVVGDDVPPGVLFYSLANSKSNLMGREDLSYWKELQDMIKEGDLLERELEDLFTANAIKDGDTLYLNEDGFVKLYETIDALFEDDDDDKEDAPRQEYVDSKAKKALISFLGELETDRLKLPDNERPLPCGMEGKEEDDAVVRNIVKVLEQEPANVIPKWQEKNVDPAFMAGTWRFLYTSSSKMRFHKSLSGLGLSFPSGKFGGLIQKLVYTKFIQDCIYYEQIDVNPSIASFKVTMNGSWDLRPSESLFTGETCISFKTTPDRVMYLTTSTKADYWDSLTSMEMLDVTYLDNDLRILRGNTVTDSIFVFQRIDDYEDEEE